MRQRTRTFVLLLVASLVIAAAPAASGASHSLKATFSVDGTSVTAPGMPDADVVIPARCGEDWPGWIFRGGGEGTLTVGKTTYDNAEFEFEHCSRWHAFDPERATGRHVGKSAAGEMIITTGDESYLVLAYGGTWVMYDFLFVDGIPVSYTADLMLRYTVEGGTGDFADVSRGHGHISMTAGTEGPPFGTGWLAGSLK